MTSQHQAKTLQTRGKLAWGKEPALILALLMQIPFTLGAAPDPGQRCPWQGREEPPVLRRCPGRARLPAGTMLRHRWHPRTTVTPPNTRGQSCRLKLQELSLALRRVESDREQSPTQPHSGRALLFDSAHLTEKEPALGWRQHNPESLFSYITVTLCIFHWNLPFICVCWQPEGGIQRCSWGQVGIPKHLKLRRHYSVFPLEELCPDAPCSQQARHKGFALNTLRQAPASAEEKKKKI